ncbi:MAG: LacI family DNA-binding transcriptional regulator, partial [Burkholderiales bacterium]|nr:LacI family DNA-binding transcriptional regulator [Opitutaceae bacterium]
MPRTPKSKSSSSLSGAPGPITMQGLAKLAGTSTNTVSLALRDSPRLSLKTRKKIHDLAALHKYRPNPLISALVKSRNLQAPEQTLAVLTKFSAPLFPHPERQMIFCRELLLGMQAKASELGFRLEEFPTNLPDSPDGVRLTQILQTRAIRGVILFPSGDLAVEHPELDWSQFAVVAGNFHTKRMWVHRTAADYSRGMEICLAELQARGYRRIGLAFSKCLDPRLRYGCSGRFLAWREQQPEDRRVPLMDSEEEYPTN